jgi:transcriptional regulator
MYNPRSYRVESAATLHALIGEHSFGTLVSHGPTGLIATHLPFMIDPARGPDGTLVAHMARANPQWTTWTDETSVLAIFQGPHSYISPGWYEQQETVPTWNYAAVHAYGVPRLVHDPEQLRPMVMSLMERHESHARSGWDPGLMESVMDRELKAIVGFEIPIDRIEGKLKFNQNRSRADQLSVVNALSSSTDPNERAVGRFMERHTLDGPEEHGRP